MMLMFLEKISFFILFFKKFVFFVMLELFIVFMKCLIRFWESWFL